jgi:hypothetical protein
MGWCVVKTGGSEKGNAAAASQRTRVMQNSEASVHMLPGGVNKGAKKETNSPRSKDGVPL